MLKQDMTREEAMAELQAKIAELETRKYPAHVIDAMVSYYRRALETVSEEF